MIYNTGAFKSNMAPLTATNRKNLVCSKIFAKSNKVLVCHLFCPSPAYTIYYINLYTTYHILYAITPVAEVHHVHLALRPRLLRRLGLGLRNLLRDAPSALSSLRFQRHLPNPMPPSMNIYMYIYYYIYLFVYLHVFI